MLDQAETSARDWQVNIAEAVLREMSDIATQAQAVVLVSSGADKLQFDAFRAHLSKIEAHEQHSLGVESALVQRADRSAILALALGAVITLIILRKRRHCSQSIDHEAVGELGIRYAPSGAAGHDRPDPSLGQKNEVGDMARAVGVFKDGLIELDRTALLRVTADTLPAMVGYIDAERRIGFLNGEFARWFDFGVSDVAEVQGRLVSEVFAKKALPGLSDHLVTAFAGEESRFEEPLTLRTGERRDVETFFRSHRVPNGGILGSLHFSPTSQNARTLTAASRSRRRNFCDPTKSLNNSRTLRRMISGAPLQGIDNLVGWIEEDLAASLTDETRTNMGLLRAAFTGL